jgi:hypothetical protein
MTIFDQPVPLYTGEELDAMHPLRARLLEFAAAQLGQQDPDRYWRKVCPELCGAPHRISWCGGFYLYNLTEVIPRCASWTWTMMVGFLQRHPLAFTREPMPGDLAYFGKPLHHYAMVEIPLQGKAIHTIDGNQGKAPDELVKRRVWAWDEVHAFYSLADVITPA